MEAAGGAIAVVSLGIQLVGTVKKASRFVQSIRAAPDELSTLGSSLEQLHLTLKKVTDLIEQQGKYEGLSGSTDLMECAVRNCESNVTKLGKLVDKLQKRFRQEGKHRTAWASLSSVLKKDDLNQYRSCIQGDLTALNTAVALSAYELNLHHMSMSIVSAGQNPTGMLPASQALQTQISSSNVAFVENRQLQHMSPSLGCVYPNQTRHQVVRKESIVLAYWGWFGSALIKTKTASLCVSQQEETPISEGKTFIIRPSFLQTAIEVYQQRNGGRVSRSLRYYPILPDNSTIFDICRRGDLEGFKVALTRNEVLISAQKGDGWTLLHFACLSANVELCSLLIHLGVDPGHADVDGLKALHIFSSYGNNIFCNFGNKPSTVDIIRLLTTSQSDLTEDDIDECSGGYFGPPEGLECMLSPDVYPVELDWHHLPLNPLLRAIHAFSLSAAEWTNLMRKIVCLSADLHRIHKRLSIRLPSTERYPNMTLLDELFFCVQDPVEGAAIARAWLSILATEGHDVTKYLETEMTLHADQECFLPSSWKSLDRKLSFSFTDEPSVEWDWWINPEASASLLCHEFRHMICWYAVDNDHFYDWEGTWPFIFPKWSARHVWMFGPAETKRWQQMVKLANSRAARRAEKKRTKFARAEGTYRPARMPGAWIN